jgi:hypothetical protein
MFIIVRKPKHKVNKLAEALNLEHINKKFEVSFFLFLFFLLVYNYFMAPFGFHGIHTLVMLEFFIQIMRENL